MEKTHAVINQEMKANEFRIENIVMYDGDIVNVIGIKQTGLLCEVWIEDIYDSVDIEELKPIELTEDVFLKCGFEKGKSKFWEQWNKGLISLLWDKELKSWMYVPNIMIEWSVELKHLHELQNLYFAITKQELEVNL